MDLRSKHCQPCDEKTPKLDAAAIARLSPQVPGWAVRGGRLGRTFTFPDFRAAMGFLNRVADVAEEEQHHPDFSVSYRTVDMTVWTHAIGGLSENDFVLAAKVDALA